MRREVYINHRNQQLTPKGRNSNITQLKTKLVRKLTEIHELLIQGMGGAVGRRWKEVRKRKTNIVY